MNRRNEVLKYSNVERFASYFNGSEQTLEELKEAFDNRNESKMLQIIRANSAFKFVGNLLTIYNSLIRELSRVILNKYSVTSYRSTVSRFGSPKKKRRRKKITYKTYKRQGKTVKRAKKRKWTKREETFLRAHKNYSNKDIVKKFNSFFGKRRYGSIISKKYRLGIKVKK